jgi:hypothetical protein
LRALSQRKERIARSQIISNTHSTGRVATGVFQVKRIVHELSFRTLLYRYFFFGWMFRDVTRGNLLERSAAWRHNQSQAHWLLTYMRRWLWCGILFYGLGGFFELMLNAPGISAVFYIPGALSLPVNAVIGAVWVGLKALPGPF